MLVVRCEQPAAVHASWPVYSGMSSRLCRCTLIHCGICTVMLPSSSITILTNVCLSTSSNELNLGMVPVTLSFYESVSAASAL